MMWRLSYLLFSLLIPTLIASASLPGGPKPKPKPTCKAPAIRQEWRTLSIPQRKSFIQAVRCLHNTPATRYAHMVGTFSEFEAFTTVHKLQTPWIHFTGIFLPWHRMFLAEYEHTLQTLCNYTGTLPYWDYTLDSPTGTALLPHGNITLSPVFHPEHGFGGNGEYNKTMNDALITSGTFWGGGCVRDGPFTDWILHPAPGFEWYSREVCLKRNIWEAFAMWTGYDKEQAVYPEKGYRNMTKILEGHGMDWAGIHGGGHMVVGGLPHGVGTANDPWTSSLEPLFYLHHANIDRVWNKWQRLRPENMWDVQGAWMAPDDTEVWEPAGIRFEEVAMTMETKVNMTEEYGRWWETKVGEVWDIEGTVPKGFAGKGRLCYRYADPPKLGRLPP